MLRIRIGKYYVEADRFVMLITDMTEGGIYDVDNSKYPEELDRATSVSVEKLTSTINGWLNYYNDVTPIRINPSLLYLAVDHLFDIDLEKYLGRFSQEGKMKILYPFSGNVGMKMFLPRVEHYEKFPVMVKNKESSRFAFIMPMISFKDNDSFPQTIE